MEDTSMPTPACLCDCEACGAKDCANCLHDNGDACDCVGCTCNMDKPETPMAA